VVVPVAVHAWATAAPLGALTLPPLVATPNLRAVPVVVWTQQPPPSWDLQPRLKRSGPAVRYAYLLNWMLRSAYCIW
jgi:hypothetical protein